jgi:hypothetical protein
MGALRSPARDRVDEAIPAYLGASRHLGHLLSVHQTPGNAGAVLIKTNSSAAVPALRLDAPSWQPAPSGCLRITLGGLSTGPI